jgi:hypothetical protein
MTPIANTLFAVTLFLALCALNLWTERRQRNARAFSPATVPAHAAA